MVLETQDAYLVEHREERPGWVVERRQEEKHVVTVFGEMSYHRTYFYHKETQFYAHLVDDYAGYSAVGPEPKLQAALWEHIKRSDLEKVMVVLDKAQKLRPERQKAITKTKRYIRGQWDGIEARNRYREEVQGCSAEGHVSHILSARLSNRPGGWSKAGAEQMASLRAAKANGLNIKEIYLAQQKQPVKALQVDAEKLKRAKRIIQRNVAIEMIRNMPILKGPQSPLTKALRALAATA
jgi:hypothetical protein